jgi:predicted PurR-regulated permease PerM
MPGEQLGMIPETPEDLPPVQAALVSIETVEPLLPESSPPWSRTIKIIVAVATLLFFVLLAWRFQTLIGMLVLAIMLAYILNPLITFIDHKMGLRRGPVIAIVYLLVAAAVIWGVVSLGVATFQQGQSLISLAPDLIAQVTALIESLTNRTEPILIGPFRLNPLIIPWESIQEQLLGIVQPALSQSGQVLGRLATSTLRVLTNALFIFLISIYLANEIPRLREYVRRLAEQPGYGQDAEELMKRLGPIWSAYLRGQVLLALIIFLIVWLGLTILGVSNALALGVLAGLLEFVPSLGPLVSAIVAVVVSFFQPDHVVLGYMLQPWQHAAVVLGLMIVIQQVENIFLVPRIVGGALDLHPIIVIIGVLMGASVAGILGAVLAAPVIASLRLFSRYAWRKMFDQPPFPEGPLPDQPPTTSTFMVWLERGRSSLARFRANPTNTPQ